MKTMNRIGLATIGSISAGVAYLSYKPMELKNPLTVALFKSLSSKNEVYSKYILHFMLSFKLLTNTGSVDLTNKILKTGFDDEGKCLMGCRNIGLRGLEIGPVSSSSQDGQSAGTVLVKCRINQYMIESKQLPENQKKDNFIIGVNLKGDNEVIQFAPYMLPENLWMAFKKIAYRQEFIPEETGLTLKTAKESEAKTILKVDDSPMDFISVSADWIEEKLGSDFTIQISNMLTKYYRMLRENYENNAKLTIYEHKNSKHQCIHNPTSSNENLQFISWQDLIKQILSA